VKDRTRQKKSSTTFREITRLQRVCMTLTIVVFAAGFPALVTMGFLGSFSGGLVVFVTLASLIVGLAWFSNEKTKAKFSGLMYVDYRENRWMILFGGALFGLVGTNMMIHAKPGSGPNGATSADETVFLGFIFILAGLSVSVSSMVHGKLRKRAREIKQQDRDEADGLENPSED
jgi:hypothetical protein